MVVGSAVIGGIVLGAPVGIRERVVRHAEEGEFLRVTGDRIIWVIARGKEAVDAVDSIRLCVAADLQKFVEIPCLVLQHRGNLTH